MTSDELCLMNLQQCSKLRKDIGEESVHEFKINFNADIAYSIGNKYKTGNSDIYISLMPMQEGDISIDNENDFSTQKFHLDFSAKYQQYFYDEDNREFIITGKSTKFNAQYTVKFSNFKALP